MEQSGRSKHPLLPIISPICIGLLDSDRPNKWRILLVADYQPESLSEVFGWIIIFEPEFTQPDVTMHIVGSLKCPLVCKYCALLIDGRVGMGNPIDTRKLRKRLALSPTKRLHSIVVHPADGFTEKKKKKKTNPCIPYRIVAQENCKSSPTKVGSLAWTFVVLIHYVG